MAILSLILLHACLLIRNCQWFLAMAHIEVEKDTKPGLTNIMVKQS